MEENKEYISKAIPTVIKFSSRASVKVKDNFYTFEYGEERNIPNINEIILSEEIKKLTDHCNNVVDDQIVEITRALMH